MNFKNGLAAAFLLGMMTVSASAATYNVDTLLGSAALSKSGDSTELATMCFEAGFLAGACPLTMDLKLNSTDAGFNINRDDVGNYFIDVAPTTPGYFLLKFGTGGTGSSISHFFFENIADFTKLVFTASQVNFLIGGGDCGASNPNACNIDRLSHYATFDPAVVPVPASLPMLLAGLGGLAALRRRRKAS